MRSVSERIESSECPRCGSKEPGDRTYCKICGQMQNAELNVTAATWTDRGVAFLADVIVFTITFGIGWLLWTALLSSSQQTPGKRFADIRVYKKSGVPASQIRFLLRDVVLRLALFVPLFVIQWGIFFVLIIVNFMWPLADRSNQSILDKIVGTVIVRPNERWRGEQHSTDQFSTHLGHLILRKRYDDDRHR